MGSYNYNSYKLYWYIYNSNFRNTKGEVTLTNYIDIFTTAILETQKEK